MAGYIYTYTQFNDIHSQFLALPPALSVTQASLPEIMVFMNAIHMHMDSSQPVCTYEHVILHLHIRIQEHAIA